MKNEVQIPFVVLVANILADLFDKGYQQRSINAYRSAIASANDQADGVSVGQYPGL